MAPSNNARNGAFDITWHVFRRRCHQLLAIGYQGALSRIRNGPTEETDITGFICEAIDDWFRDNPEDAFGFYVKDDPPVSRSMKTGKRRPRTDIVIGIAAGSRPEWVCECKRLHKNNAGVSKYLGGDGLGCFTCGRYAASCSEAAMIGYFQTNSGAIWLNRIQKNIRQSTRVLRVKNIEDSIDMPDSFDLEWASTHRRTKNTPIRIFHILLDCCIRD